MRAPTWLRGVGGPLALGAALWAAAAAPAAAQRGGKCKSCDSTERAVTRELRELREVRRDLSRAARAEGDDEMKDALREAQEALSAAGVTTRSVEHAVARALAEVAGANAVHGDGRHARLVERLGELQGAVAGAASMRAVESARAPRGSLGVAYSGDPARGDAARGPYFHFRSYPVIASVDPGSPAEAAGLEAGDTIIAFNGRDVRGRRIYHADLLRPGSRLLMRVRRDGRVRDARVAVRAREREAARAWRYEPRARARANPEPPAPPTPPRPPTPRVAVGWADAPIAGAAFAWGGPAVVAGAELARMNADLRDALGVRTGGALVLAVGGGTPAAEAGLRAGDVIVRAEGRAVTSPERVQRAVAEHSDRRRVRLEVVRKGEARRVTLRW